MRIKFLLILIFSLVGLSIILGCGKKKGCTDSAATNYDAKAEKDDGKCIYPDTIPIFSCDVEGIPWTASLEITAFDAGTQMNIVGRDISSSIVINLHNLSTPGIYTVGGGTPHNAHYVNGPGTYDTYITGWDSSTIGTVEITELNDSLKGTFNITLSNSLVYKHLTNGHFEIKIE